MRVNNVELAAKVRSAVYLQCRKRGFAAPVDVLMEVGYLSKQDYENWRYGRVDYLERVCKANLSKLSLVMREMRSYAAKAGLKPSFCYYKRWGTKKKKGQGRKPVIPLRFSKSGDAEIERRYATHFVDVKRTAQIKAERAAKLAVQPDSSPVGDEASNS